MAKFSMIFGTRPEVIKLAPVIHSARARGHQVQIIHTGQHRDLTYSLLRFFQIQPEIDLDVMSTDQSLNGVSEKILRGLNSWKEKIADADVILVQGDTVTALMGAIWGFFQKIPVGHVEAGLRTYDLNAPFPEEANRQLISRVSTFHFAPTEPAAKALEKEGVDSRGIVKVGNTSIDAMLWALHSIENLRLSQVHDLPRSVADFAERGRFALVTAHRRESFGPGFEGICQGILGMVSAIPNLRVIYPVHPNPRVREVAQRRLGSDERILLCDPLSYVGFLALLKSAALVVTDSGGVQEEAPSLRKPILVLREKTERPEGIAAGFSVLVGTDPKQIVAAAQKAIDEGLKTRSENPYGDGHAASRMIQWIEDKIYAA